MRRRWLVSAAVLTVICVAPADAQTPADDAWHVTVAPYLMGAGMSGTTGVRGREVEIDVSASDILSNLQFGVMGIVVARKGEWGVAGDAIWAALGVTIDQPPANIDPNQGMFAFYGLRRLSEAADVTFGLRWNVLQGQIQFKGPLQLTVEQTKQWVDPIVGLNLRSPKERWWHAGLYSEIGGFGVGSDFAWQIFPTVGVQVSRRLSLDFGYRWLDADYESGEGDERFVWDVLMQGPVLGFVFQF